MAFLHQLTSSKKKFEWGSQAEKAFSQLKTSFTSAPILILLNPARQFIVVVDASDTGVGAILSESRERPKSSSLCLLLPPAESRREELQHRRLQTPGCETCTRRMATLVGGGRATVHCTYGSQKPGIPRFGQEGQLPTRPVGPLFFIWFNFTLSYRPGTKNCKADGLSRQFDISEKPEELDYIPLSMFLKSNLSSRVTSCSLLDNFPASFWSCSAYHLLTWLWPASLSLPSMVLTWVVFWSSGYLDLVCLWLSAVSLWPSESRLQVFGFVSSV